MQKHHRMSWYSSLRVDILQLILQKNTHLTTSWQSRTTRIHCRRWAIALECSPRSWTACPTRKPVDHSSKYSPAESWWGTATPCSGRRAREPGGCWWIRKCRWSPSSPPRAGGQWDWGCYRRRTPPNVPPLHWGTARRSPSCSWSHSSWTQSSQSVLGAHWTKVTALFSGEKQNIYCALAFWQQTAIHRKDIYLLKSLSVRRDARRFFLLLFFVFAIAELCCSVQKWE